MKTYEESRELYLSGVKSINPSYYWVDMSVFGTTPDNRHGFKIMPAEEAEYRDEDNKWYAISDYHSTIPAY